MTTYAATINIRHISTGRPPAGKKSRICLSLRAAKAKALSSLRYITRPDAAADMDIIGHSQGTTMIAQNKADRIAMLQMSKWAINARATRHTDANGIRLADKIIVSLPRDASPDHQREMVGRIVSDLGKDSDAWIIAVIHRDRAGNPHAHILGIDGLETREAATARRPNAKRIRRRDQLRLNEGGNRPTVRRQIAHQINIVSGREGYRRAEVRSLADQGVDRIAQPHEGPYGSPRRTKREIMDWMTDIKTVVSDFGFWNTEHTTSVSGSTLFQELPSQPIAGYEDSYLKDVVR
jgi:hypothetical protein|tara:strand:- start:1325 stop:2203 length:879 start_codon:yes stop_codon:yes gene_type:complete